MDTLIRCPACGQTEALLALGARRDRPHLWLWWITTPTRLYLCRTCDALVEVGQRMAIALPSGEITVVPFNQGRRAAPSVALVSGARS